MKTSNRRIPETLTTCHALVSLVTSLKCTRKIETMACHLLLRWLPFLSILSCLTIFAMAATPHTYKAVNLGRRLVTEAWITPSHFNDIPNKNLLVLNWRILFHEGLISPLMLMYFSSMHVGWHSDSDSCLSLRISMCVLRAVADQSSLQIDQPL